MFPFLMLFAFPSTKHSAKKPGIHHGAQAIMKVSGHEHQWLAGGYDLEIGHF